MSFFNKNKAGMDNFDALCPTTTPVKGLPANGVKGAGEIRLPTYHKGWLFKSKEEKALDDIASSTAVAVEADRIKAGGELQREAIKLTKEAASQATKNAFVNSLAALSLKLEATLFEAEKLAVTFKDHRLMESIHTAAASRKRYQGMMADGLLTQQQGEAYLAHVDEELSARTVDAITRQGTSMEKLTGLVDATYQAN